MPQFELEESENNQAGKEMFELVERLFPICRSITGNGVRETLKIISEFIPLEIFEVPSGTKVFDWEIPKEWNIQDAYVKNFKGEKIIDFKKSNLHVLNYSIPIKKKVALKELKEHLYSLPDYPEWIPYLTSYYDENWGFCVTHNQLSNLEEGEYEVNIDSKLEPGCLTYGEYCIKGESEEEIVFSCYVCHPSMCNDNLSGISLLVFLAKYLTNKKLGYSYRFLFIPETIGAITWLNKNKENLSKIKCGIVATCVGDSGHSTYKKTRNGNHILDRIVEKMLKDFGEKFEIIDFFPSGSDERQFSSPGINLDFGCLTRTSYGHFKEYHTSADDLTFVQPQYLENSFKKYLKIIYILENNDSYVNTNPDCEPQLGRRGLYSSIGSQKNQILIESALLWVLNFSDEKNSLLDISIISKLEFKLIKTAADLLLEKHLLKKMDKGS